MKCQTTVHSIYTIARSSFCFFLIVYLPWEGVDTTASIRAGAGGTGSVTEDGKFNVDAKVLFDGSRILASNTILFIVRA